MLGGLSRMQQDLDKSLVGWLSGFSAAGSYTASYRVVDLFTQPVISAVEARQAEWFAAAQNGRRYVTRQMNRLCRVLVLYGLLVCAGLYAGSDYVVLLFGEEYHDAAGYVALGAGIPAVFAVWIVTRAGLVALGSRNFVLRSEGAGIAFMVAGNLLLLPTYGVVAAIIMTYASYGLMAAVQLYKLGAGE